MKIEYNNLYTHLIFCVFQRQRLIKNEHRERIEKYISGIVNHNDCKMYAIYANPDHVHFLISRSPSLSEDAIATIVANSSAKFINENKLSTGIFKWQQSASAFSVSKGDIEEVCKYILNQAEHHRLKSFQEEYDEFMHYYQKTIIPNKEGRR